MGRKEENVPFTCISCKKYVLPLHNGSYRNHCPFCLSSLHVDNKPGDRKSLCKGIMIPYKLIYSSKKGWQIIHKCKSCNAEKANKIAEATVQADNWDSVVALSQKGFKK